MKIVDHYRFNPEIEPIEVTEIPLCMTVLESEAEILEVIGAFMPKRMNSMTLEIHPCGEFPGECERIVHEFPTEDYILRFYGEVFLTTVLHELAHVADGCVHDHEVQFMNHYRAIIKLAKKKFNFTKSQKIKGMTLKSFCQNVVKCASHKSSYCSALSCPLFELHPESGITLSRVEPFIPFRNPTPIEEENLINAIVQNRHPLWQVTQDPLKAHPQQCYCHSAILP